MIRLTYSSHFGHGCLTLMKGTVQQQNVKGQD